MAVIVVKRIAPFVDAFVNLLQDVTFGLYSIEPRGLSIIARGAVMLGLAVGPPRRRRPLDHVASPRKRNMV
jgi:hypothetical protein